MHIPFSYINTQASWRSQALRPLPSSTTKERLTVPSHQEPWLQEVGVGRRTLISAKAAIVRAGPHAPIIDTQTIGRGRESLNATAVSPRLYLRVSVSMSIGTKHESQQSPFIFRGTPP